MKTATNKKQNTAAKGKESEKLSVVYPRRNPVTDELRVPLECSEHEKLKELTMFFYSLQKSMESNNQRIECIEVAALLQPASDKLSDLWADIEERFDLALKGSAL